LLNVATPLEADAVVVPDKLPPSVNGEAQGLFPKDRVTELVALVATLSNRSNTVTTTAGEIATLPSALLGWR